MHSCAANTSDKDYLRRSLEFSSTLFVSTLVESYFEFVYRYKSFPFPETSWPIYVPFHLHWPLLPFSYFPTSNLFLCRLAALQCIHNCVRRAAYDLMYHCSMSLSSRRVEVWISFSCFCVTNALPCVRACPLYKFFCPVRKNSVPSQLLTEGSRADRPVGGGGQKTFLYSDLKDYILLLAVKDGCHYDYKYFNLVLYKSLSSFASHDNIVVAQVPLGKLIPFLTKRDAKIVLHAHGKGSLLARYDIHSHAMHTALQSHHCQTCVSMVCVFTALAVHSKEVTKDNHAKQLPADHGVDSTSVSSDDAVESDYPPSPPSDELEMCIIRDFCHDTSPTKFKEAGCAVCGLLTPLTMLKPLKTVENQLHVLEVCGVTHSERLTSSNPIVELSGPVLSKSCSRICDSCRSSVRDYKIPQNALATGLWVGDVPSVLSDLRFVERLLVAKVRHNVCFVKVASGQRKLMSHVVAFELPVHKIYTKLPPPREDMDDVLAILFTGPVRPMKEHYLRTPLLVRHKAIVKALEWLKLNHQDYQDLEID